MFTGIIEELGTLQRIERAPESARLVIQAKKVLEKVNLGDSIAVNGVCLTVIDFAPTWFSVDVMAETLAKTNLSKLKPGHKVNLERAMQVGGRLGGHLVTGHIDGIGTIVRREPHGIAVVFFIEAPPEIIRYTVKKGSIAIDGISLTVVDVDKKGFSVSIIPHTFEMTTLGFKKVGDSVNLEADIIAKYVEKMLRRDENDTPVRDIDADFLARHGFL
ncbi:MAG: riboflavin synthase [Peptococcaceae bacterium]|nr:riboflavin synthase [Peptococcaceae bacterium]